MSDVFDCADPDQRSRGIAAAAAGTLIGVGAVEDVRHQRRSSSSLRSASSRRETSAPLLLRAVTNRGRPQEERR
ncbi:hypothetical protein MAHJHV28_46720 [Mycobacterium avium subsp. hominissuis]